MTGVIAMRMAWFEIAIQPKFAEQAAEQRTRVFVDPARRGEIRDRQGRPIAYTMQARSLTVSPNVLRRELQQEFFNSLLYSSEGESLTPEQREKLAARKVDEELIRYASEIPNIIGSTGASTDGIDSAEVLEKLRSDASYAVLVRNVDPDIAADIAREYYGIASDHQDLRQYPNGAIGANVIGKISQDGQGQFGFEASNDSLLSGINGRSTIDVSRIGSVIPGTQRDKIPAINGAAVTLTLDLDLQTFVQQQLEQAKANSLAKSASAVVLDVETGEVLAMANTDTIDPTGDIQAQLDQGKDFGNSTISAPFEPGSVAKIITAAGVIEDNLATPDEVLTVPGSIDMSGVNVRDAWAHGPVPYTTTGIFGKSSNVGTLMLAQRLGEQRFDDLLTKFGIGEATGIELPSESQGLRPEFSQWSGGTFANLPIGQGMSLTLLQMASVYQALANGGERIQPRIIAKVEDAQGTIIEQPEPKKIRVVKPATARTVIDMFRAVIQKDPAGVQQGTGADAAIEGYQLSGKTGTAQQVDPNTGAYSHSNYWITFAGIAPADNPKFVVALMLDRPQRGVHGGGGQSAAPLFKDIASWLLDRDNVPLSPPQEGQLILQVPE
ncbi:penicillin-binding protein 2 [Corynebacterium sp. HS2168-gen11]|nr:penicillin-binding protein 2 [Corynebacterium sp. HS2168-gen11]MCS4536188.1 penicillin-binding protein 2 [Corynebacterium sp. HS2168-gen11]